MRYILAVISVVVIGVVLGVSGIKVNSFEKVDYLRIHIRANSNSQEDQRVKYMVRDVIVESMIPLLAEAETKSQAVEIINENMGYLQNLADSVLSQEGFSYSSKGSVKNEYFPTRIYGEITLESGNYDALILSLGSGEGDNWWCIVYPAFCFLNTRNSANYGYISKIWEIINRNNK